MSKVSKRGGFSDRNAIKSENTLIQIKEFDRRTRIQLLNEINALYSRVYENKLQYYREDIQEFFRFVLGTIYAEPIDYRMIYNDNRIMKMIAHTILDEEYDDVLTLIEAIAQFWNSYLKTNRRHLYLDEFNGQYYQVSVFELLNNCFKREYVGYRFVDSIIVPISDAYEIDTINDALNCQYKPVYDHISKANRLLADRDNPDYENSIKESISAIEAFCEVVTGIRGKEATLGKMLKKMEDSGVIIHGGLKSAFTVLYGYTSDANGIRHAGDIGGPSSTFEEAKFMLVACCAFINYLTLVNAG